MVSVQLTQPDAQFAQLVRDVVSKTSLDEQSRAELKKFLISTEKKATKSFSVGTKEECDDYATHLRGILASVPARGGKRLDIDVREVQYEKPDEYGNRFVIEITKTETDLAAVRPTRISREEAAATGEEISYQPTAFVSERRQLKHYQYQSKDYAIDFGEKTLKWVEPVPYGVDFKVRESTIEVASQTFYAAIHDRLAFSGYADAPSTIKELIDYCNDHPGAKEILRKLTGITIASSTSQEIVPVLGADGRMLNEKGYGDQDKGNAGLGKQRTDAANQIATDFFLAIGLACPPITVSETKVDKQFEKDFAGAMLELEKKGVTREENQKEFDTQAGRIGYTKNAYDKYVKNLGYDPVAVEKETTGSLYLKQMLIEGIVELKDGNFALSTDKEKRELFNKHINKTGPQSWREEKNKHNPFLQLVAESRTITFEMSGELGVAIRLSQPETVSVGERVRVAVTVQNINLQPDKDWDIQEPKYPENFCDVAVLQPDGTSIPFEIKDGYIEFVADQIGAYRISASGVRRGQDGSAISKTGPYEATAEAKEVPPPPVEIGAMPRRLPEFTLPGRQQIETTTPLDVMSIRPGYQVQIGDPTVGLMTQHSQEHLADAIAITTSAFDGVNWTNARAVAFLSLFDASNANWQSEFRLKPGGNPSNPNDFYNINDFANMLHNANTFADFMAIFGRNELGEIVPGTGIFSSDSIIAVNILQNYDSVRELVRVLHDAKVESINRIYSFTTSLYSAQALAEYTKAKLEGRHVKDWKFWMISATGTNVYQTIIVTDEEKNLRLAEFKNYASYTEVRAAVLPDEKVTNVFGDMLINAGLTIGNFDLTGARTEQLRGKHPVIDRVELSTTFLPQPKTKKVGEKTQILWQNGKDIGLGDALRLYNVGISQGTGRTSGKDTALSVTLSSQNPLVATYFTAGSRFGKGQAPSYFMSLDVGRDISPLFGLAPGAISLRTGAYQNAFYGKSNLDDFLGNTQYRAGFMSRLSDIFTGGIDVIFDQNGVVRGVAGSVAITL